MALPTKAGSGSNRRVLICAGVSTILPPFAINTAAVKLAKPAEQLAPAGVGGQATLSSPWLKGGTLVMV